MINPSTFDFLTQLAEHNEKPWFEAHREQYDDMLDDLTTVAADLLQAVGGFDKGVPAANPTPQKCLTRVHRDMRFGKGKPPYKSEVFVMLNGVGGTQSSASYYLHVEPGNVYAGGGIFMTEAPVLEDIRQRISNDYRSWTEVAESASMRRTFPDGLTAPASLKNAPRGYALDDPAIEYLRMKGFCANRALTVTEVEHDSGLETVVDTFRTVKPLVDFINESIT